MGKISFKNDISKRENMKYDAESDFYGCNNNSGLIATSIIYRKSISGYKSEVIAYEFESYENCVSKSKCKKAKGNRNRQISKTFVEKREICYRNIKTELILICIGYNINKLYSKIQNERTQNRLHGSNYGTKQIGLFEYY